MSKLANPAQQAAIDKITSKLAPLKTEMEALLNGQQKPIKENKNTSEIVPATLSKNELLRELEQLHNTIKVIKNVFVMENSFTKEHERIVTKLHTQVGKAYGDLRAIS